MNSSRNSLIFCAVPTVFDVPNPPKQLSYRRCVRRLNPVIGCGLTVSQAVEPATELPSAIALGFHSYVAPQSRLNDSTGEISTLQSPRKQKLRLQLDHTKKQLLRARVTLSRIRHQKKTAAVKVNCGRCYRFNKLSKAQQKFFAMQLDATCRSARGLRFDKTTKMLALGIYYKSPAAYRFLQSHFRMPSKRTLQLFIGSMSINTGFQTDFVEALRHRVQSLSDVDRHVVLLFDSMSLRCALKYSEHNDKMNGFVDLCEFSPASSQVAKTAMQFLVRGMSVRWKHPLAHFFAGHTVPPSILQQMIRAACVLLESMHLRVVAVVYDQESGHRVCYREMGVSTDQPWILSSSGERIFMLFDIPHIIKNLRNNMMTYNIIVDGHSVSFRHLRKMFEEEQKSNLRLAPKLTLNHFELKAFKKMNVRLASQVLSHSSAVAIRTYVHFGRMDSDALHTADFIEKIDKIFDVLNSMSVSAQNKLKKPLSTKTLDQFALLEEASSWIKRWTFVSCKTGKVKNSLPFHDGFQQTVNGIRLASSDLLANHGYRYVLTTRFNQDAIENWFASVRSKGYNNDTRTTSEYELSVKNVAVNWLLAQPSTETNCSADGDSFLDTLEHISFIKKCGVLQGNQNSLPSLSNEVRNEPFASIEAQSVASAVVCGNTASDVHCSSDSWLLDWSSIFKLSDIDSNVVAYICGYLCMKIQKTNGCKDCSSLYDVYRSTHSCSVGGVEFEKHEMFIFFRNFEWAKHGLQKPTYCMFQLYSAVEQIVEMNLETAVTGKIAVMHKLQNMVFAALEITTYTLETVCAVHQSQRMNEAVRLYLRVRIHHFVRIRNRELKELEVKRKENVMLKKNRKLEKIAHH